MDFDRLEQAWRSKANTPGAQAQTYLMEQMMQMLKARRRGETLLFAIPVAAMTFFTGVAVRSVLIGRTDIAHEWGDLAMLGVCWAGLAAVFIAGLLIKRPCGEETSVRRTLEAMLAANRRARINYRIFWMMLVVFMPLLLVGVFQLHDVGKTSGRDVVQMLLTFSVALGASLGWNALRFYRVLKPEQRRLEGLLAEYGEG